jgi:hypothetical protein
LKSECALNPSQFLLFLSSTQLHHHLFSFMPFPHHTRRSDNHNSTQLWTHTKGPRSKHTVRLHLFTHRT